MEELIRARLLATAAVAAIAGSRVNCFEHPQGAGWPGVVIHRIGGAEGRTLEGSDRLEVGRIQVDCIAMTGGQAALLARAVVAALHCWSGGAVLGVFHDATRDLREGGTNEAERPFRRICEFTTHRRVT
jgi:hypothetical protein